MIEDRTPNFPASENNRRRVQTSSGQSLRLSTACISRDGYRSEGLVDSSVVTRAEQEPVEVTDGMVLEGSEQRASMARVSIRKAAGTVGAAAVNSQGADARFQRHDVALQRPPASPRRSICSYVRLIDHCQALLFIWLRLNRWPKRTLNLMPSST